MKRPPARIIGVVLLCLLAGAIVNVAVAWGLSLLSIESPGVAGSFLVNSPSEPPRLAIEVESSVGRSFVRGAATYRVNVQVPLLPSWSSMADFRDLNIVSGSRVDECASGWPLFSLYSCKTNFAANTMEYRPIWPGFAINTVFYAFILWLICFAPFAWRRRWSIKRGLCPKCAYPVGSSELCTECGSAINIPRCRAV